MVFQCGFGFRFGDAAQGAPDLPRDRRHFLQGDDGGAEHDRHLALVQRDRQKRSATGRFQRRPTRCSGTL